VAFKSNLLYNMQYIFNEKFQYQQCKSFIPINAEEN